MFEKRSSIRGEWYCQHIMAIIWTRAYVPRLVRGIQEILKLKIKLNKLKVEAARREKRFKNGYRQWKINLIEEINPEWRDLYEEICF